MNRDDASAPSSELEEGEIQIYDKENFLNTDGDLFSYQTYSHQEINWR